MMSVLEYAQDVNKTVEEIMEACKRLGIDVHGEDDMLDDEAITLLDNDDFVSEEQLEEAIEDRVEEMIDESHIEVDNTIKKEKLNNKKKRVQQSKQQKKDNFKAKKKEMYKNKEKLVSNTPVTDEKTVVERIRQAVEIGYTFFDTAEVYGTADDPHVNERLVGEALEHVRDKVVIATKFGLSFDMESGKVPYPLIPDSRPETVRKSVEGSLRRLGTDHIDLYYQHRIDPKVAPEEVAQVMSELMREGKITHWGISEADEECLKRANAVCPVTAVQNRYSMMARQHEKLFPVLEELGIGFVAFSPMANGFLTGRYAKGEPFDRKYDYRASMPQFADEAIDENRELLGLLSGMAEEKDATPAQISMAWMLCKKPWIVPIPGTRKPDRMKENAGAADIMLTADEVARLDKTLENMSMSDVFGGTGTVKKQEAK